MVKIAFHSPQLCVRGTSVALYDYANYNEKILKNDSVIILPSSGLQKSDPLALEKFNKRFTIITYNENLDDVLSENKVNVFYSIKYGKNDKVFPKDIKTVIHCVFDMSEPHGDVYAGVSLALARKFGKHTFVPHMIGLTPSFSGTLRPSLNIPDNAIVFSRYGGEDTFDLVFCWEAIRKVLSERNDIYFMFVNTPKVYKHERIFYFNKIVTDTEKNTFINSSDAHLECGSLGHSFGLAIGEYSIHNKPIIAYKNKNLWNTAHLDILGDEGVYFYDYNSFYNVLTSFKKYKAKNCYTEYTPEKVMEKFKQVFLD